MQPRLILQRISSLSHSTRAQWQSICLLVQRVRPVAQSWLLLFRLELIMRFRSSTKLRSVVRNFPVTNSERSRFVSTEELSRAMDLACVFYFKRVRCLQRSSATTVLLRQYGRKPEMVTGAQLLPYEFHAWVEIDGVVVNDKPYMQDIYQVLERC